MHELLIVFIYIYIYRRYRRICSEDRFFEDKVGELAGWLKDRGYEESLVDEQIDKACKLDRATLLDNLGSKTKDQGRGERVPFVLTYHPALNGLGKAAGNLQSILSHSEEHRKVFPGPPIIAFRRWKNMFFLYVFCVSIILF